jgi:hypothetical protein
MVSLILNALIKVDGTFKNALRSNSVLSERYLPVERLVESGLGDSPSELNGVRVFPVKALFGRLELLLRLSLESCCIVFEVFTCKEQVVLTLSDALDALHIGPDYILRRWWWFLPSLRLIGYPYYFFYVFDYFFTALDALDLLFMDIYLLLAATDTEADTNQKSADNY